jgi:hypothetical protein
MCDLSSAHLYFLTHPSTDRGIEKQKENEWVKKCTENYLDLLNSCNLSPVPDAPLSPAATISPVPGEIDQ